MTMNPSDVNIKYFWILTAGKNISCIKSSILPSLTSANSELWRKHTIVYAVKTNIMLISPTHTIGKWGGLTWPPEYETTQHQDRASCEIHRQFWLHHLIQHRVSCNTLDQPARIVQIFQTHANNKSTGLHHLRIFFLIRFKTHQNLSPAAVQFHMCCRERDDDVRFNDGEANNLFPWVFWWFGQSVGGYSALS